MLGELVQTTHGKWITRRAVQPHGEKRITYICIEQDRRSGITASCSCLAGYRRLQSSFIRPKWGSSDASVGVST